MSGRDPAEWARTYGCAAMMGSYMYTQNLSPGRAE